ncbi:uncharacterized protein BX663DRAFT_509627 [Cokeromyces recurvatus]|uniref:uncharacterized protein n=1 Tax=Cokeromyces recurvatus TaxID=90255 RepID=UPI00221E80F1|nr:uncharacterized protein BX663DRAFT_509627 [Cokeromyces recurvatus]KAI7903121.1 hypothetical protein BX663DRAFT_509627 [Cokeromyces recurvatus]
MISPDTNVLNAEQTKKILERLNSWKNGICANGKLASQSCFVLKQRPHIYIHPEPPQQPKSITTEIITEWPWAENLVESGAITNLNDDMMIKTMSDFFMIFHYDKDHTNHYNTLHLLRLYKHASFNIDNIYRPTRALEKKLQQVLHETNRDFQWEQLVEMWNLFGYLWPRKIIIGYRTYLKKTYPFRDIIDGVNGYYYNLSLLKDEFDSLPNHLVFDLNQFLDDCVVISRLDMTPIHELFNEEAKNTINSIINEKFTKIPAYYPVKFYNISTHGYLCWDPVIQQDPVFGGNQDYLIRAITADHSEIRKSPECQYLWRFTWKPIIQADDTMNSTIKHRNETIRGFSKLYIYPACKSTPPFKSKQTNYYYLPKIHSQKQDHRLQIQNRMTNELNVIETNKWMLVCPHRQYEAISSREEVSKLKSLRLLPSHLLNFKEELQLDWTVEYPYNGLKYMTDTQLNIKLNFHEYIRRMKPVLNGDIIQLQQVGLLTAFNPASYHDQQSHKIDKDIVHQHNTALQHLKMMKGLIARKASFKSKNKKIVLCINEDITRELGSETTFWRVELPNEFDMLKHSDSLYQLPISKTDQKYEHTSASSNKDEENGFTFHHFKGDNTTTKRSSLRRTKSLGSLYEKQNVTYISPNSDKAAYFEGLVHNKEASNLLTQFFKNASLQPLAQFVKPARTKPPAQIYHSSPSPFTTNQQKFI